jgi:hypothetical protein
MLLKVKFSKVRNEGIVKFVLWREYLHPEKVKNFIVLKIQFWRYRIEASESSFDVNTSVTKVLCYLKLNFQEREMKALQS